MLQTSISTTMPVSDSYFQYFTIKYFIKIVTAFVEKCSPTKMSR